MTEILMLLEEAREKMLQVIDRAREKGLGGEPFFGCLVNSYAEIYRAFALMRAYGRMDPKEYGRLMRSLFKP